MDFYNRVLQLFFYWAGIGNPARLRLCHSLILVALYSAFFLSCNNKQRSARALGRAFYYWKSTYELDPAEQNTLYSLHIRRLYIKYFDVDWDPSTQQPLPKAMIRFKEKPLSAGIVPTVFITNECLQQLDSSQIPSLAEKIVNTIFTLNQNNAIDSIKEIQIDCDWSASTQKKYFDLLHRIHDKLPVNRQPSSVIQLSATIRLYQVKYRESAGVPPVDKGMLMCYNMGNLKNINSKNSIIETAELEKYIGQLPDYPLPLDVAFPIFDWKVWFRDGKYYGITEEFPTELLSSAVFIKTGNNYKVLKDTLLAGYELKKK